MSELDELQTRRTAYLAAELKILQSQEYAIGDGVTNRSVVRARLEEVRQAIADLDSQIATLAARGTRRVLYIR